MGTPYALSVTCSAFDQHGVAPLALAWPSAHLRDAFSRSHDSESGSLVKVEACLVLRKDRRLDGPDTCRFCTFDELVKQKCAETLAVRFRGNVDRMLHNTAVGIPR